MGKGRMTRKGGMGAKPNRPVVWVDKVEDADRANVIR